MRAIQLILWSAIWIGASSAARADQEHCLVIQAIAVAAHEARMQLLIGTDEIFTSNYRLDQQSTKEVSEKYRALFAARNKQGREENPENRGEMFISPSEREAYFRKWNDDITALEKAQSGEFDAYSESFMHAMDKDPNQATRRRLARINALWNKEFHAPCYWGEPK